MPLPTECWELVIDSCNIDDPWPFFGRRTTYSTLRSCALTCKAFHSRSRLNLLRSIELNTEAQVDLLIRTLTQQPFLADLVTEVFHRPPYWSTRPNKYVPLARSPLPSLLRNCQSLAFPLSSSLHQTSYIHALASFSHITRLAIYISGHSISTLLHAVWSYPEIYQLSLSWEAESNWKTTSEVYERRLSDMRPPAACRNLKSLHLSNFPPTNFPLGVFGNSVSHLDLNCLTTCHNDNEYWAFLSGFLRLQSLNLTFVGTKSHLPSRSGLASDEVLKLSVFQLALSHVGAYATLRSIRLLPVTSSFWPYPHEPSASGDWTLEGSLYFVISRLDALELLFGRHIGELLRPFPRLDNYQVELYDNADREGWWMDEIKKRIPDMFHAIHLRLEPFGETENPASDPTLGGWLEDIPPSPTTTSSEKKDEVATEQTGCGAMQRGQEPS